MDFLKYIAFPQSLEHIAVLHLAINVIYALFVPYTSVLFIVSVIAVYYERKGVKEQNQMYTRFARELMHAVIPNKSSLLLFGVLPYLAILMGYAQLLQDSTSVTVSLLFFSFLLFTAGVGCLFTYQYTFRLNEILALAASSPDHPQEIEAYAADNVRFHARAGLWGASLLAASQIIFELAAAASNRPYDSETLWDVIFLIEPYVRMGQALSFACMLTGAVILYLFFVREKQDENSEYAQFVRAFSIRLSFISVLVCPVFVLLVIGFFPETGLTGSVFGITTLVLLMLFAAGHIFYALLSNFSTPLIGNAVIVLLAALILAVVKDQIAFGSATRYESVQIAARYDKEEQATLDQLGLGAKPLTGQEIFDGRCSACHTFTVKKVGPPYKETLPKYEGKRDQLVAFILNPRKMNPGYPPMPNQGLKPAEADSIAAFIMKTYKEK